MKQVEGKLKFAKLTLVVFVLFFTTIITSYGANRYLVATGNWDSPSCWSETSGGAPGATVPADFDFVYIERGFTVAVSKDTYCKGLFIGQENVDPGNIVVDGGVKLANTQLLGLPVTYTPRNGSNSVICTISGTGNIWITNLTIGSTAITPVGVQTTTLVSTIANMKISGNLNLISDCDGSASNTNSPVLLLNEGLLDITGNIIPTSSALGGDVTFRMDQGNHTGTLLLASSTPWQTDVNFKSPWGTGSNSFYNVQLNAIGTTVAYTGAAQSVRQLSYYNLTLAGSDNKTLGSTTSVDGTLSLQGSAMCINSPAYGASSTLEYKGSNARTTTDYEFVSGANGPANLIIENMSGVALHSARTLRTGVTNTLTLKSGMFKNADFNITLSDNSTIIRTAGSISAVPIYGTNVNIIYAQHTKALITSKELPSSSTTNLKNLTIDNTLGITLSADAKAKGVVTVNGMLICGLKTLSGTGAFIINNGAVLKTQNTTGINGTIALTGTKTFNDGASYFFNGTIAQITGSLFPSAIKDLTIENTSTGGVTLSKSFTATGLVSVTKILHCSDKVISGSGSFTLGAYTTIFSAHPDGIALTCPTGSIQVTGTRTYHPTSNFTFNGTVAQNTGKCLAKINKLTIENAAGVTLTTPVSEPALCGSLEIKSGALFIVEVGKAITIEGTTTLGSAECLVIKSTPSGSGSIIDNGFSGPGTARIERWVSNNGSQRWEYVSSPITNASSTVFTSSIHTLRWADEVNNRWQRISHVSPEPLKVFRGYVRSYQATNDGENTAALFVGTPNTGELTADVTYTADAPGLGHGWNLVGNPYPSAMDWDAEEGWIRENINNAIYFRKNGFVCTYIDGEGLNDASSIIPSMQAFWIRVTDENGGTLSVDNRARVHNEISIFKGAKTAKSSLLLTISTADYSKNDEISVRFKTGATEGFDSKYDAPKMYNDDVSIPQIYSITGIDTMAINSLKPLYEEKIVKLGFKNLKPGKYIITVDRVSSLTDNGNTVFIENIQTGKSQDLSVDNSFVLEVRENGKVDDIILHFNSGLLPIQLLSFEPKCLNNETEINWSTATEINNHYFIIERSKDAIEWEFVNKTLGSGNSNVVQNYSFIDKSQSEGTIYYRLTQTDYDGQSKTFNPVAINCNVDFENISFYPNPFSSSINVMVNNSAINNAVINIYNSLGVNVYSNSIPNTTLNRFEIDLQELPVGIYTIEFKSDTFSTIKKIIKK